MIKLSNFFERLGNNVNDFITSIALNSRQKLTLIVLGLFLFSIASAQPSLIRNGIKECKQGKELGGLESILKGMEYPSLRDRWWEKGLKALHSYPRMISKSDVQIRQLTASSPPTQTPMEKVEQFESVVSIINTRLRIHDAVVRLQDQLPFIVADNRNILIERLQRSQAAHEASKDLAASHLYQHLLDFMNDSTEESYQEAYYLAIEIEKYRAQFRNVAELKKAALRGGSTVFCLTASLPTLNYRGEIAGQLLFGFKREMWHSNHQDTTFLKVVTNGEYPHDFRIHFTLTDLKHWKTEEVGEEKTISKKIIVDKAEKTVMATVSEVQLDWHTAIAGRFLISDTSDGNLLISDKLQIVHQKSAEYANYTGDYEAIRKSYWSSRVAVKKHIVDPEKVDMESSAAFILGNRIYRRIHRFTGSGSKHKRKS